MKTKTAERAYYLFLERQQAGLPGDAHLDWLKAEREVRTTLAMHLPPRVASRHTPSIPLDRIKGIGPKIASEFAGAGIRCATALASWTMTDFAVKLPHLIHRAAQGDWVKQAQELARKQETTPSSPTSKA